MALLVSVLADVALETYPTRPDAARQSRPADLQTGPRQRARQRHRPGNGLVLPTPIAPSRLGAPDQKTAPPQSLQTPPALAWPERPTPPRPPGRSAGLNADAAAAPAAPTCQVPALPQVPAGTVQEGRRVFWGTSLWPPGRQPSDRPVARRAAQRPESGCRRSQPDPR